MADGKVFMFTRFTQLASTLALLMCVPPAFAGGLEFPDNGTAATARGGAFTARADDLTALIHNPAGLIHLKGTGLLLNHSLVWHHSTFTRAATGLPVGETSYGEDALAPVSNESPLFPLGASLIVASDFGLEDWAFAFGLYGPNASGAAEYPLSGGQRYMMTSLDAIAFYPSLAVAWGIEDTFSVGVTLQAVIAPKLKMSMVVDGSLGGELSAYYSQNDVVADIEMEDLFSFSALMGLWWRPIPELEIGLSGRVLPISLNLEGDFALSNVPGQTQFSPERLLVTDSSAKMDLVLPPTARFGIRYRGLEGAFERFDIEVDVVYEAWSTVKDYTVDLEGQINLFAPSEAPDVVIDKRWRDTLSVRLGSTVNLFEGAVALSLGGFWESGAVPEGYEHLDFMSFMRYGFGLGIAGDLGPVRLTLAYGHVFQEDREVSESAGKVYQVRPLSPCPEQCDGGKGWSGVPANAGRYESSFDTLAVGVEASF